MDNKENQIIGNISTITAGENFGMKSTDSPFAVSFYFEDYFDEKASKQFIKNIERLIRTSREYKTYIELLRTNIYALNHDSMLSNITTADVDLEFHHTPLTLYDIIEIVILYHISKKDNFTSFSIAKEVMNCHYQHIIGITPLTTTMHELAHSGNILIKKSQIFGDYDSFLTKYKEGVSADILQKISQIEELSGKNVPSDFKGWL